MSKGRRPIRVTVPLLISSTAFIFKSVHWWIVKNMHRPRTKNKTLLIWVFSNYLRIIPKEQEQNCQIMFCFFNYSSMHPETNQYSRAHSELVV